MQIKVDWQDDVHFVAKNDNGHKVAMDGPPEQGGQDRGSRPTELMLLGLGGFTAFDVVDVMKLILAQRIRAFLGLLLDYTFCLLPRIKNA